MKPAWRNFVAPAKYAFLIFALFTTARADTLGENAMGSGSLCSLLQNDPTRTLPQTVELAQKQPYFILTPSYRGSVSLAYHRGALEEASDKKRELHFEAFTRATAFYDEPDCPKPRLPTIFEFVKAVSGEETTGEFAFFCKSLPSIKRLSTCRTFDQLNSVVPNLVQIFDEDDPHAGFWYNWFRLTADGQIDVVLLKAVHDIGGKLPQMEIWTGTLNPCDKDALEPFASTDNLGGRRLIRAGVDAGAANPAPPKYIPVTGLVRAPGKLIWTPDLTLLTAIDAAGGWSGNPNVYIIRGKERIRVRLTPIMRRQAPDPVILPGDQIEVLQGTY